MIYSETHPSFGERVPYLGPFVRGISLVRDLFENGPPDGVSFEANVLRSSPEVHELRFPWRTALRWRRRSLDRGTCHRLPLSGCIRDILGARRAVRRCIGWRCGWTWAEEWVDCKGLAGGRADDVGALSPSDGRWRKEAIAFSGHQSPWT